MYLWWWLVLVEARMQYWSQSSCNVVFNKRLPSSSGSWAAFWTVSKLLNSLNDDGNWFHTLGADILKDRAAKVLHLVKGTISLVLSVEDLRLLGVGARMSKSLSYCGAVPYMLLWVIVAILKSILCLIRSQWSCASASVVLSYLDFLRVSFAHIVCMICRCEIVLSESP